MSAHNADWPCRAPPIDDFALHLMPAGQQQLAAQAVREVVPVSLQHGRALVMLIVLCDRHTFSDHTRAYQICIPPLQKSASAARTHMYVYMCICRWMYCCLAKPNGGTGHKRFSVLPELLMWIFSFSCVQGVSDGPKIEAQTRKHTIRAGIIRSFC